MGALHIRMSTIEEAASNGRALSGVVVGLRGDTLDLQVDHQWDRNLPERPGLLAQLASRVWPARDEPPRVHTVEISPPPVAKDAFSHPLFQRLADGLRAGEVRPGDRVIVLQNPDFTGLLRDDPTTRARVAAAFDRSGDVAWATAASVDELHTALLDRALWDAAFEELRWRRKLDARGLLARIPPAQVGGLRAVFGRLEPAERSAFVGGAVEHLARTGDRATLVLLTQSLFDFAPFQTLEPLLLALDPKAPAEQGPLTFARVRLAMILRDEPHRAASFARLTAHLAVS